MFWVVQPSFSQLVVSAIPQDRLKGISSTMAQMSTWTQGWTDSILVAKSQGHCPILVGLYLRNTWRELHYSWHKHLLGLMDELIRTVIIGSTLLAKWLQCNCSIPGLSQAEDLCYMSYPTQPRLTSQRSVVCLYSNQKN